MPGAGNYFCGTCLAERPFYGALESGALSGIGLVTAGLSVVARELLKRTAYRPVCGACGTAVRWRLQGFLGREEWPRPDREPQSAPPLIATLAETQPTGPDVRPWLGYDFREQAQERYFEVDDPAAPRFELKWEEHFGTRSALLSKAGTGPVAKLVTDLHYLEGSSTARDGDAVFVLRSQIMGSGRWLEVYRPAGYCLHPLGLPKWKAIIHRSLDQRREVRCFAFFRRENVLVYAGEREALFFDAAEPARSRYLSPTDLFGHLPNARSIQAAHCCGPHVLVLESIDYAVEGEETRRLTAIDSRDGGAITTLGQQGAGNAFLHTDAGLVLIASSNIAWLYRAHHWQDPVRLVADGEIAKGAISTDGQNVLLRIETPSGRAWQRWTLN